VAVEVLAPAGCESESGLNLKVKVDSKLNVMVSFFCEHENGLNKLDVNAKIIASIYFLDVSFSFTLNVFCFLSPSKNSSTI